MPELPEVETIASQLQQVLKGQKLLSARVFDRKRLHISQQAWPVGGVVSEVHRAGKQIVISFSKKRGNGSALYVIFHLRMTGRLLWFERNEGISSESNALELAAMPEGIPDVKKLFSRAELNFAKGRLMFSDVRRFGTIEISTEPPKGGKGLDPLSPDFDVDWLCQNLSSSKQNIKNWLLRQDKLLGLGNIYACEALFKAGINPNKRGCDLISTEISQLHSAIVSILKKAIKLKGTTFSDFQDAHGTAGGFQRLLMVYDRHGEKCRRCEMGRISRVNQNGRGTYFCPLCQS